MALPPVLEISPPLLNTPTPAASGLEDLTALYDCPYTGAVTTRTSLLKGFPHDDAVHQFVLFEAGVHDPAAESAAAKAGSLNTLGYSPLVLDEHLGFVKAIATRSSSISKKKGFVVSVTGGPEEVAECYRRIVAAQEGLPATVPLAMEVNLSCPNIPNKPPPAYNGRALQTYLAAIQGAAAATPAAARIPVGLKTPPYTYAGQFAELRDALLAAAAAEGAGGVCPISFLTATNTLGSSLVLTTATTTSGEPTPALPLAGIGGMAGAPLHPLALGNVATLRRLLDEKAALGHIRIIGAGGVSDAAGYARMKSVGAYAVGVGTGVLMHGVDVFGKISGKL